MILSISLVLAAIAAVSPALAQIEETESPLTTEEEMRLLDFASALAEPPLVEIRANLMAPTTLYIVELLPAEKSRIDDLIRRAEEEIGLSGYVSVEMPKERWYSNVSCGTFAADNNSSYWQHPEGEAPDGCPHEDGTSHEGTVYADGNVFISFSKDSAKLLYVIYDVKCTYNGSENGTENCQTELEQFSGFYGGMFSEKYGHNTKDNDFDPWNKSWLYVGVTVIVAGVGYTFWRRKTKAEKAANADGL